MGLFTVTDTAGLALNKPYAEDVNQLVNGLTGLLDLGALSLLRPLAAPAGAPAVTLSAGGITGTGYQWGVYWISGVMDGRGSGSAYAHITGRTLAGPLTVAQALTAQQATVSIAALTPPAGTIGWGVVRNKSAGAAWFIVPGSETFLNQAGTLPNSFVDNAADSTLVTAQPAANTTGTTLAAAGLAGYVSQRTDSVSAANTDLAAPPAGAGETISLMTPGGGTVRSIGAGVAGQRISLRNFSVSNITVKQTLAGGTGAQINCLTGADTIIPPAGYMELLYGPSNTWDEVARANYPNDSTKVLLGNGLWANVTDGNIAGPISVNKLALYPTDGTKVLKGDATWAQILDAQIGAAAAISISKLAGYPTDGTKALKGDGTWVKPPGYQWDYAQITANPASSPIITGNAVTFDGTQVVLEFWAPLALVDRTEGQIAQFAVDGVPTGAPVSLGQMEGGTVTNVATLYFPGVYMKMLYTPTAVAHVFSVQSANPTWVRAGAGGANVDLPAFLRVTKA